MGGSYSEDVRFGEGEVVKMGSHCSGSGEVIPILSLSKKHYQM